MGALTLIINLEHRTDRRAEMHAQLERVGWHAEFLEAIQPDDAAGFPSIGARGCFLSHLACLEEAKTRNVDRLTILEDDLNFSKALPAHWPGIERFISMEQFDLLYPGHILPNSLPGIEQVPPSQGILCTHFMVLSRTGIDAALQGLRSILSRPPCHPLGGPMHVDGAYSTIRSQSPEFMTFAHFPSLGYQRPSKSNIATGRWADKYRILSPIMRIARKAKSSINC